MIGAALPPSLAPDADADADPGLSMLVRMGWSEGQGLGKDGQGMRTPLVAKKTDSATGVIVNATERNLGTGTRPPGSSWRRSMASSAASMSSRERRVSRTTWSHCAGVSSESLMRVVPVTAKSDV